MRNYLVASHGPLAYAMVESLELILGKQENIYTLCAYIDSSDINVEVKQLMGKLQSEGEVFVFSDLFGGSVNQILMKYINETTYVFSGVNLALLLTAVVGKETPAKVLVEHLQKEMGEMITYCNLQQTKAVPEEDF